MSDPWPYKGWFCDPPEQEEPPGCPECGGGMSELVYFFDGSPMCEECYRETALEHIHDLTTMEIAELLKDKFILRENWNGE